MNKIWNDSEKQYIKDNAATMKDREIAEELTKRTGRVVTTQAVRKQRQKLGIAKAQGRGVCAIQGSKHIDDPSQYVGFKRVV